MKEITKKGQSVLLCLKQNENIHMTAEDIAETLKKNGIAVSVATIYRQLEKLVSSGKVRKYVTSPEEPACYQYMNDRNAACTKHFHLKCTSCGKLFHVSCPYLDKLENHILAHHGFSVDNTRTVLYGVCENCRKQSPLTALCIQEHKEDESHETLQSE